MMVISKGPKLLSGGRGSLGIQTMILPFRSVIFMLRSCLGGMKVVETRENGRYDEHVEDFAG